MRIITILLIGACLAPYARADETLTLEQVLERYVATMDAQQRRSVRSKSEVISNDYLRESPTGPWIGKTTGKGWGELWIDEKRAFSRTGGWNTHHGDKGNDSVFVTYIANGQRIYLTYRPGGTPGSPWRHGHGDMWRNIPKRPPDEVPVFGERQFAGYFVGGGDKRIDEVLRTFRPLFRVERGPDGKVSRYVASGTTGNPADGTRELVVWFDPQHGYNVAKVMIVTESGQAWLKTHPEGYLGGRSVIEVTRFQQIDGTWVAMECDNQHHGRYPERQYTRTKHTYTRTEVILNPDFDALGVFTTAWIPEGAHLRDRDQRGVSYTWEAGELVPVPKRKRQVTTAADVLSRYRGLRTGWQVLRAEADTTIRHGPVTAMKYRNESSEFRWDQGRGCYRARTWGFLTHDGESVPGKDPRYTGFSWNGAAFEERTSGPRNESPEVAATTQPGPNWKQRLSADYTGAALLGILAGDAEFVDVLLEKADSISLLEEREKVGKLKCVVIEAKMGSRAYRLWFAPRRRYSLVKARVTRGAEGDRPSSTFTLDNVALRQVNSDFIRMGGKGLWVPFSGRMVTEWRRGGITYRQEIRHKRTHVEVKAKLLDPQAFAVSVLGDWRHDAPDR